MWIEAHHRRLLVIYSLLTRQIGSRSPQGDMGFGSPFPGFPSQQGKANVQQEQEILDQMKSMEISGPQTPCSVRSNSARGPHPHVNGYAQGPGPMDGRGAPPRGYPAPGPDLRGPPGDFHQDYFRDRNNGGNGPRPGLRGPPRGPQMRPPGPGGYERSMTMPANTGMGPPHNGMTLQRINSTASSASSESTHQMPPRPSTATANQPTLQRSYTAQTSAGQGPQYDAGYGPQGDQWRQESSQGLQGDSREESLGQFYDNYYYEGRANNRADFYQDARQSSASDMPDFDAAPQRSNSRARDSLDQHLMAPATEQEQSGPNRVAEASCTKSHPNLRQPKQAVFEMADETPPMPTQYQPPQPGYGGQYNDPREYQQPPPPAPGFSSGPGSVRSQRQSPPAQRGPGSAHPPPVRPGLMPDSVVSQVGNRPPPVRMHSGPPPQQMPTQGGIPQQQAPPPIAPQKAPKESLVSLEELEELRTRVKIDPNDQATALRMAKKLVEASEVLAPDVPDPKIRQRARERYVFDSQKILKKLVNAQNPDAMFFLADCVGRGALSHEPDSKEAFTLYQSAAKLGHPQAAYRTAVCCEIGNEDGGGTRKDPLKAIQWYKRAATLGDTPAMYKVGMILLNGLLGQPKNPREAVGWLKRAAERADAENPHALHELGLLYESAQPNDAIIRDEQYAFTLFKQAAEIGYKFSQFRLGAAYEFGLLACPIDPRQSIVWYSRAALQEEHQSELALSGWYLTGSEGVLQQSDTEAYLWARKAAMAGLAKAEYAMGYFTEVGIGVPANLEDAKRWYWRSACKLFCLSLSLSLSFLSLCLFFFFFFFPFNERIANPWRCTTAQDFPKARERLEDIKRSGKNQPRQRERITRSKIGRQQENECVVM